MKGRHLQISTHVDLLKHLQKNVFENLRRKPINIKGIITIKLIFYSMMVGGCYATMLLSSNPYWFVLSFIGYGFSILLLAFNFAHDFSHGSVFKKPIWNDWGFVFIYALNGAHAEAWKKRHVESHHFAPNVEHYDSDLEITSLIRVTPTSPLYKYHKYQSLYAPILYTTYSLYWVFIKDFFIYNKDAKAGASLPYHASFWVQKTFYLTSILILPILYAQQPLAVILIGFLLMHLLQSAFLLFTFFMTHHVEGLEYPTVNANGVINASWLMNQVKSSNDMHPFSKVANFLLGGFNNHIAHHLFPRVHHAYYPQISRIIYQELKAFGVVANQTTYWGGIASHIKHLKAMGFK